MGAEGGDELMIWGYACKLFRDDEKAMIIDRGKHLIPWMGDEKLMIDRYDGRGALYDLSSHEPAEGAWDSLSHEDREMEAICDNERYRAMYEEDETVIFTEEEEKKLQSKYGSIAYSYDDSGSVATCEPPTDMKSKTFSPPPGLVVPSGVQTPDTMKQHAIIVKTAAFITQQGSQMEILMRLKQQGNYKFNFLTHGDVLHEYYKFLLDLIKTGSYSPSDADTSCLDDEEDESESDHYLHPSLMTSPSGSSNPNNPPPLTKVIIEKMVKYILKNGLIFEEAIRKLDDSRFSFVNSSDTYYNYYREKVTSAFKMDSAIVDVSPVGTSVENSRSPPPKDDDEPSTSKVGSKRKPTPVCFSLKKPKDIESLEVSTALPQEDSTDDEEQVSKAPDEPPPPPPAPRISKTPRDGTSPDYKKKERKAKVAKFLKDLKYK